MSRNLEKIPSDLPLDTVVLLLASNHITKIPNQAFKELHRLQELDLSNNDIETVDVGAFQGVADSLRILDLSNNRIQSVPKEAFAHLRAKISLSNNPWHCECTLQEVLRELRLDPVTVNEVSCHTAVQKEYAGKPVIQVLDSGINFCNFHQKTTDVAMFVTMFGWFTMVIGYIIYYVRHNQEDARRHMEYLKSLPSSSQISKNFDNISTIL
ncbi:leucine-rich repeat-containing protein 3-like [Diretmus argenteus]